MTLDQNLPTTLDELVFEQRNKRYGAYVLRKIYSRHMLQAFLAATFLFFLLIEVPALLLRGREALPEVAVTPDEGVIITVLPPDIEKRKPEVIVPAKPEPAKVETSRFVEPRVVQEPDAPDNTLEVNKLKGVIGAVDQNGTVAEGGNAGYTGTEGGTGTVEIAPPVVSEEPVLVAEVLPAFPGGQQAITRYISSHIRVPEELIGTSLKGSVFVSFVVDKAGQVAEIKVEKGLHPALDREVMRVVGTLKGFAPALQNGQPVKFRYIIPVKFTLQ